MTFLSRATAIEIAVYLVVAVGWFAFALGESFSPPLFVLAVTIAGASQVGLFIAPSARRRRLAVRLGVSTLMMPALIFLFIGLVELASHGFYLSHPRYTATFVNVWSVAVYLIQLVLLLRSPRAAERSATG